MINTKDIVILAVYGYILFYVLKPNQTMEIGLATIVAFFLLSSDSVLEGLENSAPADSTKAENGSVVSTANDQVNGQANGTANGQENGMASRLNMGTYDGLCLKTGNNEYWKKSPDNTELIPNDQLFTYLGSQGPIKMALSDQAALSGPSITGKKGAPEKMSSFANNQASLSCCPSTYSTSTGCICTTEDQRNFINSRGMPGSDSATNEF